MIKNTRIKFINWDILRQINKSKFSTNKDKYNLSKSLRELSVAMCIEGGDGHIPSSFSLIEIITYLHLIIKINIGGINKLINNILYYIAVTVVLNILYKEHVIGLIKKL